MIKLILLASLCLGCTKQVHTGASFSPEISFEGPTWVYWCKRAKALWQFSEGSPVSTCPVERRTAGIWPKIPINVSVVEPVYIESTLAAIEYYNDLLGFDILAYKPSKPIDVIVMFEKPRGNAIAGMSLFTGTNGGQKALIAVHEKSVSMLTMVHELGHALGLPHNPASTMYIMHPTANYKQLPRLHPVFIQGLMKRYGSQ